MSKPISYTSAVTFYPTSATTGSNITTNTQYPISNGYNGTANTSRYARLQLSANNTSTDCYIFYTFNVTGIPAEATINSVSCSARLYRNQRVSGSSSIQLYANTTAKGSIQTGITQSQAVLTISNTGSWSLSELANIRLRITGRRTSTSNNGYIYFYGADLTINYTVDGTAYEITAESTYTGATALPATQEVMGGESATIAIYPDDINNIVVEDNGTDVTGQLQYVTPTPGTETFTDIPTSYDANNSTYDSIYTGTTGSGLSDQNSSDRICVYANTAANSISKLTYNFNCSSIPANATITSVTCIAAASCYSSGQYFNTKTLQLYNGNTAKGTATTITGNGSTKANHNINGGTWTRGELNDIKIVIYIERGNNTTEASFSFWGATLTVNYTLPSDPYYAYTLTNVSADHDILVSQAIIVPPEEDPTKTYYSLTISSINSTTDPGRGTTRVESGTGQTITITPSDPQLTLALDNGVDVSNQLVPHGTLSPSSAVTNITTTYGFTYNSSTGYYVSNNNGVSDSAAVARVTLNLPVRALVTFQYINYAEATYDFGVFSKVDTALSTAAWTSSSNAGDTTTDAGLEQIRLNTSSYNTANAQTLTYEISAGEHFIDVKYAKDQASDEYNDSLQFKITNIELLEPTVGYYTYDLSNISADHSLVFIFGNVTYYFVTSSTDSNAKLYPDGQMVELPGETYRLTIVPENSGDTITVRDNNVDVTSSLERKEIVVEKGGQQVTVVNYIYHINNVQTGHTVVVYSATQGNVPYIKINGSWVQLGAIWKKENGVWVEQEPSTDIFDDGTVYVKGE